MGFFDLNIPFYESDRNVGDKSARKTTRLKLVVKAMELGYTGVAYNRTIKGVMSEAERCATPVFPLSSILKLAPSIAAAVKLHRERLNVPLSAPFRQYTRLTVTVDSPSQASALNSGNPILKTYDIVAVRPMTQTAFDQACQASEVDIIAIDFADKLPFRLKQHAVKAAIKRGVYFEITYSGLLMDAQVRRQMISNAKLLVDWTRGKNIVFSSSAPSVTELRGPYDVANLSLLLGLSMERAKAALSINCRSLITNALRRKQYFKEAIRVEVISPGKHVDSKESNFSDWMKWDPISSGEGDLLLDDSANSRSASREVSNKTVKAIDFASLMVNLQSTGMQISDLKSELIAPVQSLENGEKFSGAEQTGVSITSIDGNSQVHQISPYNNSLQHIGCEDSEKPSSPADTVMDPSVRNTIITNTTRTKEESNISNDLDIDFVPLEIEPHDSPSESCLMSCDARVVLSDHKVTLQAPAIDSAVGDADNAVPSKNDDSSTHQIEESRSSGEDLIVSAQDHTIGDVLIDTSTDSIKDLPEVSLYEAFTKKEQLREMAESSVLIPDALPVVESHEMKCSSSSFVMESEQPDEMAIEEQNDIEDPSPINYPRANNSSGKGKVKQRTSGHVSLRLKHFLNPTPFKTKVRKSKNKTKLR